MIFCLQLKKKENEGKTSKSDQEFTKLPQVPGTPITDFRIIFYCPVLTHTNLQGRADLWDLWQ